MLTQEEYSEQLYTEDEILLRVKEAIVQAGMPPQVRRAGVRKTAHHAS